MATKRAILLGAGLAALLLSKKKRKASDGEHAAEAISAPGGSGPKDAKILVFTAEWCGVCKKVLPKIREIDKGADDIDFEYIDTDDQPEVAKEYGITGVPTFIAFRKGEEVSRVRGYRDDDMMAELMALALGDGAQIKALPDRVHLPVVEFGPDYMTGEIPTSANYRPALLYNWMPLETKGSKIIVGPRACQYCASVAEPKDGRGAYCIKWKAKVAHNHVCNNFEPRADL